MTSIKSKNHVNCVNMDARWVFTSMPTSKPMSVCHVAGQIGFIMTPKPHLNTINMYRLPARRAFIESLHEIIDLCSGEAPVQGGIDPHNCEVWALMEANHQRLREQAIVGDMFIDLPAGHTMLDFEKKFIAFGIDMATSLAASFGYDIEWEQVPASEIDLDAFTDEEYSLMFGSKFE